MKRIVFGICCALFSFYTFSQTVNLSGINSPSCFGQCNGDISFSITGATGPFSVSITNTLGCTNPTFAAFTNSNITLSNMCACQYFFTFYDGASSVIGTKTINLTQPNILILNTSPDPTICYGQITQIYGVGSGGTPPYSYNWNPSSLIGSGPHSVSPTVTTQYTVNVSDFNGCITAPQIITVNVRPPLLVSGNLVAKCDGSSTVLTPSITSPGNGGPYTYNWSEGSSTNTIVVTATYSSNPNTYSVMISDGCTSPSAVAVFTVYVNPTPSYTPVISPATCSTCCNGSVQLTGTCGGTASCTFYISPGGITTPTAGSLCTGTYSCSITNQYGCIADLAFTLGSTIGINELILGTELNIYPNPSDGNINIKSSKDLPQLNYEIYDIVGNKINSGKISEQINLNTICEGVYFLEIKSAEGIIIRRQEIIIKH